MGLKEVFFGESSGFKLKDIGPVFVESIPGLLLVFLTGFLAYFLTKTTKFGFEAIPYMKYVDILVLAVVLGMLVRLIFAKTKFMNKLLPGIILAPVLLIPFGIILYGMKFRVDKLAKVDPLSLVWLMVIMAVTLFLIYWLSVKVFKQSKKMGFLLGTGSAVCGASAIAITSPVVEADPDEMGTALVTNTLIVIASLFILKWITGLFSPEQWAAMAGSLLHQTGFVKIAVAKGPLQDLALLIKSTRVALLILIIPVVYYMNKKKLFIPWYMILFIGMGLLYSYAAPEKAVTDNLKLAYSLIFTTALASIGMNANIVNVFKRLGKPFLITLIAFVAGILLFWVGTTFIAF